MTVKMKKTLGGFTLTELLVGLVLFSMVMAVSGVAVSSTMNLLFKETNRTVSSGYARSACDFVKEKIKLGVNVEFVTVLEWDEHAYDNYFDSPDDVVLYVGGDSGQDGKKIYLVENISGGIARKEALFESAGMDIIMGVTPDADNQSALIDITITEKNKPDKQVCKKTAAVRRLNKHTGCFKSQFDSRMEQGYYIFIDVS